jgi:hypothetical protein
MGRLASTAQMVVVAVAAVIARSGSSSAKVHEEQRVLVESDKTSSLEYFNLSDSGYESMEDFRWLEPSSVMPRGTPFDRPGEEIDEPPSYADELRQEILDILCDPEKLAPIVVEAAIFAPTVSLCWEILSGRFQSAMEDDDE